jgi:DNA-binding protein HU-beta|tara:strand:- start:529 stop:867 length:339 start_codon:yes stop_codon:yes gene_type:complete
MALSNVGGSRFDLCRLVQPVGGTLMNKSELAKAIADKAGITKAQAGDAIDAFADAIVGAAKSDDSVQLAGFGTFHAKHREAREVRNPRTGEKMMSKAKTQLAFRPASALKDI